MTLTAQFYTMISMICMGGWLGAAIDTYGRFLKRSKRARFFVFINDILFWILQGLIIFYMLFIVNEGELRFYVFVALLCGYAAYQSLVKSFYLRVLEKGIETAISLYKFFIRTINLLIIKPIKMLIQLLITILLGILNILLTLGRFLLKVVWLLIKILFTPFKWLGILLWRLVPKRVKEIIMKIFHFSEGISKKIENMKDIVVKWWKKIRKS